MRLDRRTGRACRAAIGRRALGESTAATTSTTRLTGRASRRRSTVTRDLLRWSEALAGIARTGLGFTESLYERERYEEVLEVAADIRVRRRRRARGASREDHSCRSGWRSVGDGVPGYVTPKVAVGAVVGNDKGEILLVQRADSGIWLYPTGWADIGYSPAEVAVKEVRGGDRHRVRAGAAHRR